MPKSRNNKTTKRGTHSQRVLSHDKYLETTFPDQFNLTNPFSSPIAELLDEEISNFVPNKETLEAMAECDNMVSPRFNTVEELMAELNKESKEEVVCPVSAMSEELKKKLEEAGYTVSDTQEFLGLTNDEMAVIEERLECDCGDGECSGACCEESIDCPGDCRVCNLCKEDKEENLEK